MTIKTDSKRIRDSIASTRQAMVNARNRTIPKFEHPERPKRATSEPAKPTEATADELERDVARTDERTRAAREEYLHAARRAHVDGALRERLTEHARRDDDREHPDAADAGEPRVVGDAKPCGARESFEVYGRREAHAGSSDDDAMREHLGGGRLHLLTVET